MRASFISDRQCGQIGSWNAGTMLSLNQQVGSTKLSVTVRCLSRAETMETMDPMERIASEICPVPDILKHSTRKARDAPGTRYHKLHYAPLGDRSPQSAHTDATRV